MYFRICTVTALTISAASLVAARAADTPPEEPSYDECRTVATAKYDQWRQQRVLIDMTKTFADGHKTSDEIIVDSNTAYGRHGNAWKTGNLTMRARLAPTMTQVLDNMGLALCARESAAQEGGVAATLYTYSCRPDKDGYVAQGKIWIADESGLPLREEMTEAAPPANDMVATAMAATYHYGDFVIPPGAERAESTRLFNMRNLVNHMQSGSGTALGGGSR